MEPTPQEESEGRSIVDVLGVVLERLVATNAHLAASSPQEETKFHALRAPAISIRQYLERIHKYASCSKECFVLGLVYIDRLVRRDGLLPTDLCVHRIVITAILLAAKFFDDAYYNNAYYARVGGVLASELNALECEFLFRIDFSLRVTPEEFHKYRTELLSHASAMNPARMSPSTDVELCRQVLASQQHQQPPAVQDHLSSGAFTAAQTHSLPDLDSVMYPNSAPIVEDSHPGAPELRTYCQLENIPAVNSKPAPVAHQGVAALLCPIQHTVTSLETSGTQQQQIGTSGLDRARISLPVPSHPGNIHQWAQTMQYANKLDLVYPALATKRAPPDTTITQYQALPGATFPQAHVYVQTEAKLAHHHALTTPLSISNDSSSSKIPVAAVAPVPFYSHHNGTCTHDMMVASCFQARSTALQPSMQLQSHTEITPSPHPPQPAISMQNVADCQLSHYLGDNTMFSSQPLNQV